MAIHAQNTHNTGTKTHNHTSGGEIKTIQTGLKNLEQVICLGPSCARRLSLGAGGAPRQPSGTRRPETDNLSRLSCPVGIVYIFGYQDKRTGCLDKYFGATVPITPHCHPLPYYPSPPPQGAPSAPLPQVDCTN